LFCFQQSRSSKRKHDGDDDDDEVELECLGSTGGANALVDFPHARAHCLIHPFEARDFLPFCPNCFCYICDVRAAECTEWASHCKATSTNKYWQRMREEWKIKSKRTQPSSVDTHDTSRRQRHGGGAQGDCDTNHSNPTVITGNWNFPTWEVQVLQHTKKVSIRGFGACSVLLNRLNQQKIENKFGISLKVTDHRSNGWGWGGEEDSIVEVVISSNAVEDVNKTAMFIHEIENNPDKYNKPVSNVQNTTPVRIRGPYNIAHASRTANTTHGRSASGIASADLESGTRSLHSNVQHGGRTHHLTPTVVDHHRAHPLPRDNDVRNMHASRTALSASPLSSMATTTRTNTDFSSTPPQSRLPLQRTATQPTPCWMQNQVNYHHQNNAFNTTSYTVRPSTPAPVRAQQNPAQRMVFYHQNPPNTAMRALPPLLLQPMVGQTRSQQLACTMLPTRPQQSAGTMSRVINTPPPPPFSEDQRTWFTQSKSNYR
jgi:hypothetical protein